MPLFSVGRNEPEPIYAMKRCVFCFAGLLAAICLAICIEYPISKRGQMDSPTEPGEQMALQSERAPEGWEPPSVRPGVHPDPQP